jgi:hypothetical protein
MTTLAEPVFQNTLNNYYYDSQFKRYLIQFMALFDGLQVSIGKNDLGSASNMIRVPVKHGSVDRVVQAILSDNTQNKLLRLPLMSAKITDISMGEERMKGTGTEDRHVYLPLGESMPDGLQVVRRRVPVPYVMNLELAIYASNLDQQNQIHEQILLVFDPSVQIQLSDKTWDWTKINIVKLEQVNLEENYPANIDRRMLISSLTFSTTVWLSAPASYKQDYIKSVQLRLAAIDTDQDTQIIVREVGRPDPPYEKLFDIEDYNMPPN